ncbi:hypothetical protein [Spongiactinospora sp. 9N601]|uniref:hypothetical protein n=1 Tax=Spongiactinospora sp. 9N601 TaxID=3375149 RepID=UPI00378B57AE
MHRIRSAIVMTAAGIGIALAGAGAAPVQGAVATAHRASQDPPTPGEDTQCGTGYNGMGLWVQSADSKEIACMRAANVSNAYGEMQRETPDKTFTMEVEGSTWTCSELRTESVDQVCTNGKDTVTLTGTG